MRLKPTKYVGLGDIRSFVIKGCSLILSSVLKHTFYLSISLQHFPTPWQQAAIVPTLKKGNSTLVSNCKSIYFCRNFCKLLEIVVYERLSPHFKNKLNSC